jgi:hypothetical protein
MAVCEDNPESTYIAVKLARLQLTGSDAAEVALQLLVTGSDVAMQHFSRPVTSLAVLLTLQLATPFSVSFSLALFYSRSSTIGSCKNIRFMAV